ncbi:MAG: hypothetical protein QXI19_05970 [Candidatus Caldarchaeum sp.]
MHRLWEYRLTADILCIGERIKKGIVRPCVKTIPYSTITGALRQEVLGIPSWEKRGHAVGCIDRWEEVTIVGGPRDTVTGIAKIPLTVRALSNVLARVYIVYDESTKGLPAELSFSMGALKSKGFGFVYLTRACKVPIEPQEVQAGYLQTRIPDNSNLLKLFGIEEVKKPVYGYLFKPTSETDGVWVRSLFEGSIVKGPSFLVKREG